MNRNVVETALGAVVLVIALVFLVFALHTADASRPSGYQLLATFTKIDGIKEGADVRVSGIKAGTVAGMSLDSNYRAVVTLNVDNSVHLPVDSAAVVASGGLLGDKFISLEPGGDDKMLKNGDKITMTQSPPGLEQLLGQVIFSMSKSGGEKPTDNGAAVAPTPVSAPVPAMPSAPKTEGTRE